MTDPSRRAAPVHRAAAVFAMVLAVALTGWVGGCSSTSTDIVRAGSGSGTGSTTTAIDPVSSETSPDSPIEADSAMGAAPPTAVDRAITPVPLGLEVLERRPHDTNAFTQGLVFDADGRMFESTGLTGQSEVREVDLATGAVVASAALEPDQFGEGLAIGPSGLVQLTWKNGLARTWSLGDLEPGRPLPYDGEGWGLTFDGSGFLQSDGSGTVTRRDATTFEPTATVEVTRIGAPVDELNELEVVGDVLYANVWHSDEILRIDPTSGVVTGVIDGSKLWQSDLRTSEMTLNGIAHRPGDPPDVLWVTGKNWPELFRVRVVERAEAP